MNIPTQFTDDSHYQNTIIKHSRRLIGYFNYGTDEQRMNFGNLQHPNKNGFADCSSLVWLVMKQAGYNVGQTAFSTPEMGNDAKNAHQYFRQIHAKNVKPGDIVIVNVGTGYGPNGHTAIIDGSYHGKKRKLSKSVESIQWVRSIVQQLRNLFKAFLKRDVSLMLVLPNKRIW